MLSCRTPMHERRPFDSVVALTAASDWDVELLSRSGNLAILGSVLGNPTFTPRP
jgi:hypothetical protein